MNKLPCYTPFPPRDEEEKEDRDGVCHCGHAWFQHGDYSLHDFFRIWLKIFTLGHYGERCTECSCNMYHFMAKLTYSERRNLEPCTENKS